MTDYTQKKCEPCEGGIPPLDEQIVRDLLEDIPGWEYRDNTIHKIFRFNNYNETVSFVGKVANLAKEEDHHPEITFGYKTCEVVYTTHAISGVSENDLICAAKINALLS